tara:strand:+ start:72 stop:2576 length:2505 start_codon:yes stop_codon:yes gene_type:complete
MDLTQSKLTKSEWNNTEIPVSDHEKFILTTIVEGFSNVNIRKNNNKSMFSVIKIEYNQENEMFLFDKYFEPLIKEQQKYVAEKYNTKIKKTKQPKKADIMRIDNMDNLIQVKKNEIYEFILLDFCKKILKSIYNSKPDYAYYLYTLIHMRKNSIDRVNDHVWKYIDHIIAIIKAKLDISHVVYNAYEYIEKNPNLLKYEDITLFSHQKELFSTFRSKSPKLVLYIAPTGTGKTLSPIGLSEKYRVIFICVSRHVGLALAKSSISMGKRVAFAFGCDTASDIRLHYFAASSYTRNKRTGGIGKVDNSVGDKVEIMICDVQSYLTAMYYMLSFNEEDNIVTYWDEPTITMDYEEHGLHEKIQQNWKDNKISKLVLSCATLPHEEEIQETLADFRAKFENAEIVNINSHDFKKSISLLDKDCKCVLPHLLYSDYDKLKTSLQHISKHKTLLRYFDLQEIVNFIRYIHTYNLIDERYKLSNYFDNIDDVTMNRLKMYYLTLLNTINRENYIKSHNYLVQILKYKFDTASNSIQRMKSVDVFSQSIASAGDLTKTSSLDSVKQNELYRGLLLTTRDAHTLTDGPTIFMAEDVQKIAKFYVKTSNIPKSVFQNVMSKITSNNGVQEKLERLQEKYENLMSLCEEDDGKDRKSERKENKTPEIRKLANEMENMKTLIQNVNLDKVYVPNSKEHQQLWTKTHNSNLFTSDIDETNVRKIMELSVSDDQKILLLMGIGTFDSESNVKYLEIMKTLAYEQKLFIIIASTDYIYGTNYMFSHGYIGKDLTQMTQQKIIQAMGRIGRNKVQQDYTVRFRDNEMIDRLFNKSEHNLEATNMNKLFNS